MNSTFSAVRYASEIPITKILQASRVIENPRSKTPNMSISPHLDRVTYAKDQRVRRNHLSKSAPARVTSTEPFAKKNVKLLRTSSGVSRINFSQLANYWTKDRSVLARETKWENAEPSLFSMKPKMQSPKRLTTNEKNSVMESWEQKLALLPPTQSDTTSVSPIGTPKSSPSPRPLPPPNSVITRALPETNDKTALSRKRILKPDLRTKTPKTRPKSATKPLFSLTSIEVEEADILRETSPEGKKQAKHYKDSVVKYKSTSSGIKFLDFGPTSSSQKQTNKVRVLGFGRLRSTWSRNKKKEVGKDVKLCPGVAQVALFNRAKTPLPKPSLKYHHLATMDPTCTTVKQAVSTEEVEKSNPSFNLEKQGFITASYINRILNRSNNCSNEKYKMICVSTMMDILTDSKETLNLMSEEDEENAIMPMVNKLSVNQKEWPGKFRGVKRKGETKKCISIPSGTLIDNFSDVTISSGSESGSELADSSTEFNQSLLNVTYSSLDASIVEVELDKISHNDGNYLEVPTDEFLNCTDVLLEQTEPSDLTRNKTFNSKEQIELGGTGDLSDTNPDISVEPIEEARATGINSPEFENNPNMEGFQFLYFSKSTDDTSESDMSELLSSNNEMYKTRNETSEVSKDDINSLDSSLNKTIFNKAKVKLKHHSGSKAESTNNSSFNSSNNLSILSKALKLAGIHFPCRNDSFRMAMKNPLKDTESSFIRQRGNCLKDLLNEDDHDLSTFSVASVAEASQSSLSILSDFSDDLENDRNIFMKTSTPIKHSINIPSPGAKTPGLKMESKTVKYTDNSSKGVPSTAEIMEHEMSSESVGNSSEEEEVIEIIYTTSSSEDDFSEENQKIDFLTSAASLNSTRFSQISDISYLGSSIAMESDASLNNLNFTDMMNPKRNCRSTMQNPKAINQNVTWYPEMPLSLSSSTLGNNALTPRKRKLRRSNARTNLLLRFDDDDDDDDDVDVCVKNMIKLGNMKSPCPALKPEARNDEIYKVRVTPRRYRYSKNPSSSQESQFWAPRQYIEETEKAVNNLLKAEFSSPDSSF